MTPIELLNECKRVDAQGLTRMILTIPRRRGGRLRSNRVRIMPGVLGNVVGSLGDGRLMVDVAIADVVLALAHAMGAAAVLERVAAHKAAVRRGRPPRAAPVPCDMPSGPIAHDGDEPEAP